MAKRYEALPTQQADLLDPTKSSPLALLPAVGEAALAAVSWASCSIGMTLLNKLSVSKSGCPYGVVMVQMAVTCLAAVASRNLHFGEGTRRWAVSVPALFVAMMVTSMLALQYVRVGTFVVVRNVAPIITLFAGTRAHPASPAPPGQARPTTWW